MDLKNLSDSNLLLKTKNLVGEKRKLNLDILHHLKEIEIRKLHLEMGYSSLFEYATKDLGYSEDAAYRRISAMRLIKNLPEVEQKIAAGSLSLTSAYKIQNFLRNKEKIAKQTPLYNGSEFKLQTKEENLSWIESLENKSSREVEKEIIKLHPEAIPQEKVRMLSEEKIELKLIIDEELKNQLDQLKNILSHINPNMSYQELIKYLVQMGLEKLDPAKNRRSVSGAPKANPAKNQNSSRFIPVQIKREIYNRDQGCCSYINPTTNQRCSSRYQLQIDHKFPYALGGENTVSNLRLFCKAHNLHAAQKIGISPRSIFIKNA